MTQRCEIFLEVAFLLLLYHIISLTVNIFKVCSLKQQRLPSRCIVNHGKICLTLGIGQSTLAAFQTIKIRLIFRISKMSRKNDAVKTWSFQKANQNNLDYYDKK